MIDQNENHNKTILKWETPEFIKYERGKTWHIAAGVIVLSLIAYGIISGSATMAIVFILLAGVFFMTQSHEPKIVDVKITELGIRYGKVFYPYNNISAFWVIYHPPYVRVLNIQTAGKNKKRIKIELSEQNPVEIRRVLSKEIPEIEGGEETITDILIRLLRLQ